MESIGATTGATTLCIKRGMVTTGSCSRWPPTTESRGYENAPGFRARRGRSSSASGRGDVGVYMNWGICPFFVLLPVEGGHRRIRVGGFWICDYHFALKVIQGGGGVVSPFNYRCRSSGRGRIADQPPGPMWVPKEVDKPLHFNVVFVSVLRVCHL